MCKSNKLSSRYGLVCSVGHVKHTIFKKPILEIEPHILGTICLHQMKLRRQVHIVQCLVQFFDILVFDVHAPEYHACHIRSNMHEGQKSMHAVPSAFQSHSITRLITIYSTSNMSNMLRACSSTEYFAIRVQRNCGRGSRSLVCHS
jgi:hypothetical protein